MEKLLPCFKIFTAEHLQATQSVAVSGPCRAGQMVRGPAGRAVGCGAGVLGEGPGFSPALPVSVGSGNVAMRTVSSEAVLHGNHRD